MIQIMPAGLIVSETLTGAQFTTLDRLDKPSAPETTYSSPGGAFSYRSLAQYEAAAKYLEGEGIAWRLAVSAALCSGPEGTARLVDRSTIGTYEDGES